MQDISRSSHLARRIWNTRSAPFLYTISCMHCMTVSLAHGGAGLGTMWGGAGASRMLARRASAMSASSRACRTTR